MADDIALFFCKLGVGHGRLLPGPELVVLSGYQTSRQVLLLAQVVHFELESTQDFDNTIFKGMSLKFKDSFFILHEFIKFLKTLKRQ